MVESSADIDYKKIYTTIKDISEYFLNDNNVTETSNYLINKINNISELVSSAICLIKNKVTFGDKNTKFLPFYHKIWNNFEFEFDNENSNIYLLPISLKNSTFGYFIYESENKIKEELKEIIIHLIHNYAKYLESFKLHREVDELSIIDTALNSAKITWYEINVSTRKISFLQGSDSLLKFDLENIKSYNDLFELLHPKEKQKIIDDFQFFFSTKSEKFEAEHRIKNFDGEYIWFNNSFIVTSKDSENNPIILHGLLININERKRVESITKSRLYLAQFSYVNSLDDLIEETLNELEKLTGSKIGFFHFVEEDQINLTLQNWSSSTKKNFCKAEGKGMHYPISSAGVWTDCVKLKKPVIHNDYPNLSYKKGLPDGHAPVLRELVVPVIRDQKIKAILGVGNKSYDYNDWDVETVMLFADSTWEITERKRVVEQLIDNEVKLKKLNDTKDKFFSIIAHDLKNPLGSLKDISKVLLENYSLFSDEEKLDYLEMIKASSENLFNLMWNLLEWSRTQNETISFNPIDFDLYQIVKNISTLMDISFSNKSLVFINKIEEYTHVFADPNLVSTVIRNLLSNAIKFSNPGNSIEIGTLSTNGDSKFFVFYVKDQGEGIKQEVLDKLFRIDVSISTIGTNQEKGTGLGLILCKEFIEKHNGKIWIESEVGYGSIFYFTLPKNCNL